MEEKIKIIKSQEEFEKAALKDTGSVLVFSLGNAEIQCDIKIKIKRISSKSVGLYFNKVKLLKRFDFDDIKVHAQELRLEDCEFNEDFIASFTSIRSLTIKNSIFGKALDFSTSLFSEKVEITYNDFHGLFNFSNSNFLKKLEIPDNNFNDNVDFGYCLFKDDSNFKSNKFKRGAGFEYSIFERRFFGMEIFSFENKMDFSFVTFSKDSFLTQSYFDGGLSLYSSIIKETLHITDIKVFSNNSDRETLRIIKNLFLKQSDRIQALNFHEKEMKVYEKDLIERKRTSKKELKRLEEGIEDNIEPLGNEFLEDLKSYKRDFLILISSRLSNHYGLSWWQGVKFTLFSSLVGYFVYILCHILQGNYPYEFGWDNWEVFSSSVDYTLKYYFQFLWPTHKFDFMAGVISSPLNYLIDILSRIVVGFGVYQTIQAFRKFGKI
ncbi:hypothetical protein [uncultured Aquimarina sp.]|uniref:hypothetical protein n=1 Tax=uncultured Aquimarina sp. TaxID=575652 RepID=UPI002639382B|nr:hypothetical protein [uncultured Aquimarina sp.]